MPVVTTSDSVDDVRALLDLGPEADARGVTVAVGATAFSPGLACVLARFAADQLDTVDEIHVSRLGTGGPASRQHHDSLRGVAIDWRDGGWQRRPAGSGRELSWFPDPIGSADCYHAALPDALLLVPAFSGVGRVTAHLAATRRDQPHGRAPHAAASPPRGGPGRGAGGGAGSGRRRRPRGDPGSHGPAGRGRWRGGGPHGHRAGFGPGRAEPGAAGLAELVAAKPFLAELARRRRGRPLG